MSDARNALAARPRSKRNALAGALRDKASELTQGFIGSPGSLWGELMNAVMAGGRSVLPGGGSYEDELQRVREGWEEQYPGAYSVIPEVRRQARNDASRDDLLAQAMGMAGPIKLPALRRALTARSAELLNDPPARIEDFVPMKEFRDRYRGQYVNEQGAIPGRNSRFDKSVETLEPGTWVIDDMNGIHGREIGYVTEVDPGKVDISEYLPEREPDVQRYAEWMREGHNPPPVEAVETDRGGLKIGDGHRRRRAAIAAGRPLPAVVWPTGPHPKGAVAYGETEPMRVGLTYEMLQRILADGGGKP